MKNLMSHDKTRELFNEALQLWNSNNSDKEYAIDIVSRLARDGNVSAMKMTAHWYMEMNLPDYAIPYLVQASDNQDVSSMVYLASIHAENGDMTQAQNYWKEASELGDSSATLTLAKYLQSEIQEVPEEDSLIFEYTKKASDLGCTRSMKLLAEWSCGSSKTSYDYYMKAGNHGDVSGFMNCATMNLQGEGVDRNISLALELFIKVAKEAAKPSLTEIGHVYCNGLEEFQPDTKRAFQLFQEASAQDPEAHKALGDMYLFGIGIEKDLEMATEHFEIAIERKCTNALVPMAICCLSRKPPKIIPARSFLKSFLLQADMEDVNPSQLNNEALDYILDAIMEMK